ncbi:hypothetical protein [Streptomyces sp. NPDC006645]|uniref:hypothetical protein n=1 Tax=Streptomyces sp. NPDC006645 TaxID=3157184 RepID=UPI0033A8FA4F
MSTCLRSGGRDAGADTSTRRGGGCLVEAGRPGFGRRHFVVAAPDGVLTGVTESVRPASKDAGRTP